MRKQALLLFLILSLGTRALASGAEFRPATGPAFTAPCIKDGLSITLTGRKITIAPGALWINDKLVSIDREVSLDVPPCPPIGVRNVPIELVADPAKAPEKLVRLGSGLTSPKDTKVIDGTLVVSSITVTAHPDDAASYKQPADYFFDNVAGTIRRTSGGSIKEGQKVFVDCSYSTRRLDTILANDAGQIKIVCGIPSRSAAIPRSPGPTEVALAHVYAKPGSEKLASVDVLPIQSSTSPLVPLELRQRNAAALAQTIQKLETGQPVTIVFWGDSITAGADASKPERSFAELVVSWLREKYPRVRLTVGNAGVGGSNTTMRLPRLDEDVLKAKPDLIVVEFINDLMIKKTEYESNFRTFLTKAKERGAEVLIVVPSMPTPKLLGVPDWNAVKKMPYYTFLRDISRVNGTALADVEGRWEQIGREGLTPDLLLSDGVIHPNDLGHRTIAEEIIKCFR